MERECRDRHWREVIEQRASEDRRASGGKIGWWHDGGQDRAPKVHLKGQGRRRKG